MVRDGVGWPHYGWMPDGHMSALWDNATARWLTFYPNHESFRWEGLQSPPRPWCDLCPLSQDQQRRVSAA